MTLYATSHDIVRYVCYVTLSILRDFVLGSPSFLVDIEKIREPRGEASQGYHSTYL